MKHRLLSNCLCVMSSAIAALSALVVPSAVAVADDFRPNVIVIMSDDQGGGDYGFLGNEIIRTPHLDQMRTRSGLLSNFYVSPVCAPTRASLMTGRYNYRTRCIDTFVGRAMMDPDEVTLAEVLRDVGYRTGIFGKWHLGDNYPMRAMDQGFQESLVHRGGGIGQPSDPIGAEGKYTNPTLIHNGKEESKNGYCTDIYFSAAMEMIQNSHKNSEPFFAYIATNAPHGPFHDVPEDLYQEYKKVDFSPIVVGEIKPQRRDAEFDKLARIAAMITNIDENVGKLFDHLDALKIRENTIVIYLNDNGPNSMRYVGNMRGMKSHVDDGGIRSPLLFHWPQKVKAGSQSAELTAHLDIMPTILEACQVTTAPVNRLDGVSFLSVLTGQTSSRPERTFVVQSHRGNVPVEFHNFALHQGPWKLVHPSGFGNESIVGERKLELYNLKQDPKQQKDLSAKKPEIFNRLSKAYDEWFQDVSSTRPNNYAPPRIVVGTKHELVTVLTRQDWRHESGQPWGKKSNGFWLLDAPEAGIYQVEVILRPDSKNAQKATIKINDVETVVPVQKGKQRGHTVEVAIPAGCVRLSASVSIDENLSGPHQVILSRVEK